MLQEIETARVRKLFRIVCRFDMFFKRLAPYRQQSEAIDRGMFAKNLIPFANICLDSMLFTYGIVPKMSADSDVQIRVRHIDHVTLVVRDVEASRRFYVGLLGMIEVPRPGFSFDGAWFQAGATLIHLIAEHDRSGPAGYPVEVLVKSSRNHHFAFEVDDAYASAAVLKAKGIPLIDDAKLRPDGAVQVFLADPDHHVVELCTSPR
jgi:catechol 2,3-dioxygenase-like lactoylglutathione lyase family enzyme